MAVSTFKIRYDNDNEFRDNHLKYLKTKIKCDGCGKSVARSGMIRHKQSNWHKKNSMDTSDVSELRKHKKEINRTYNEKIRTIELKILYTEKTLRKIKKEKQKELDNVDKKINKRLNA